MTNECWGRKGMAMGTGQRALLGKVRSERRGEVYARVLRLWGRSVCGQCVASGGSPEQEGSGSGKSRIDG